MRKWLPTLVFGLSMGIVGCGSTSGPDTSTGGAGTGGKASGGSTGGSSTGGSATGGSATGGKATGGSATGGAATGGSATGGAVDGGTATGGSATGGKAAGGAGTGGASVGGSSGTGGGAGGSGDLTAAKPSKGCGMKDGVKTLTTGGASVQSGLATSTKLKITTGGMSREYIIDIPTDYDSSKPYRLVFSWHQAYGSDTGNANGQYPANPGQNFDAKSYAFFGLRRAATDAGQSAIFVAPGGIGDLPWDFKRDLPLFDDLLTLVTSNLCIDENRVFTTGFSYGAMMSYALSVTRQSKLRAAITMAAANYALPNEPTDTKEPIAYFGITGMSDTRCPWVNSDARMEGGKYCVSIHAADNGCTSATFPTATVGSKKYVCYDYAGCKSGYPVKVCTFDGNHTPSAVDDGTNGGDDGLKAFMPPLAWKFISQF